MPSYPLPPEAGAVLPRGDASTAASLTQAKRPPTPDNVRKWRKSNFAEPGQKIVHPGMIDDFKGVDPTLVNFGKMQNFSEHVEDVLGEHKGEFDEMEHGAKEAIYYSRQREPLGKSYSRGHTLPDKTKHPEFEFGKSSASSASAKNLIYGKHMKQEDESVYQAQYIKSHGSYAPGEQRTRAYQWRVDPATNIFGVGVGSQVALNGRSEAVRLAINGGDSGGGLVPKGVNDFKGTHDPVGGVRHLGTGVPGGPAGADPKHTYGKASVRGLGEWDARACIQGDYSEAEQDPDTDLGKTHTPGFRNTTNEVRPFGVPTVRSDIPKYARRSIADNQNYGDDVNAQFLLYPSEHATVLGVGDDELKQTVEPEQAYEVLLGACGDHEDMLQHLDMEFAQHVYDNAAAVDQGKPSIHTLTNVFAEMMAGR